jgi:hypothetical protein
MEYGSEIVDTFVVPMLTRREILEKAIARLKPTQVDEQLWKLWTDADAGPIAERTYGVVPKQFAGRPRLHEVVADQEREKLIGCPAAFLVWLATRKPLGKYAVVPNEPIENHRGARFIPFYISEPDCCVLSLDHVSDYSHSLLGKGWNFLGFQDFATAKSSSSGFVWRVPPTRVMCS